MTTFFIIALLDFKVRDEQIIPGIDIRYLTRHKNSACSDKEVLTGDYFTILTNPIDHSII